MIEAIYILFGISIALFITALALRESIIGLFSAFLFVLAGLSVITQGFGDLVSPFTTWLGIVTISAGGYIGLKAGLELIGVDK